MDDAGVGTVSSSSRSQPPRVLLLLLLQSLLLSLFLPVGTINCYISVAAVSLFAAVELECTNSNLTLRLDMFYVLYRGYSNLKVIQNRPTLR
jgi:hypothetical protein